MNRYCPACDEIFASMTDLKAHLEKALKEPDAADYATHVEVYELEGWAEVPMIET